MTDPRRKAIYRVGGRGVAEEEGSGQRKHEQEDVEEQEEQDRRVQHVQHVVLVK